MIFKPIGLLGFIVMLAPKLFASEIKKDNIVVIGGGAWGTAVARRICQNVANIGSYQHEITLWLHNEMIGGRNLSDAINEDHVNEKYLPNISLPNEIFATSDMDKAIKDADLLVFACPHQFLPKILNSMIGKVKKSAIGLSLIKGLSFKKDGPELLSKMIADKLQLKSIAVLMGANIASEVASDQFVEATVASPDPEVVSKLTKLFECKCFNILPSSDVSTVELCGALKNVIAMAAGFCEGMGLGKSTVAAVLRQGLAEMADFCRLFNPDGFQLSTMMSSCGMADLVASAFGGRNRLCAAEFARRVIQRQVVNAAAVAAGGYGDASALSGVKEGREGGGAMLCREETSLAHGVDGRGDPVKGGQKRPRGRGREQEQDRDQLLSEANPGRSPVGGHEEVVEEGAILRGLWAEVEEALLRGQKLQGLGTCDEVVDCLEWMEENHIIDPFIPLREHGDELDKSQTTSKPPHTRQQEAEAEAEADADSENSGKGVQGVQGVQWLSARGGRRPSFPLLRRIHAISRLGAHPTTLIDWRC